MNKRSSIVGVVLLAACALGDDSNPFATAGGGGPVTTVAPVEAEDSGESTEGDGESTDGGDDDDDDESSSGGAAPMPMPMTTTTTTTTGADPDTGDEPDPTGVPDDSGALPGAGGMYDHCLQPEDCGAGTTACLQIVDDMNVPVAGFCTHEGCVDPQSDCVAPDSGTAQPYCLAVMVGNMADAVCALDCGSGETCPVGTMCIDLGVGFVCG